MKMQQMSDRSNEDKVSMAADYDQRIDRVAKIVQEELIQMRDKELDYLEKIRSLESKLKLQRKAE